MPSILERTVIRLDTWRITVLEKSLVSKFTESDNRDPYRFALLLRLIYPLHQSGEPDAGDSKGRKFCTLIFFKEQK